MPSRWGRSLLCECKDFWAVLLSTEDVALSILLLVRMLTLFFNWWVIWISWGDLLLDGICGFLTQSAWSQRTTSSVFKSSRKSSCGLRITRIDKPGQRVIRIGIYTEFIQYVHDRKKKRFYLTYCRTNRLEERYGFNVPKSPWSWRVSIHSRNAISLSNWYMYLCSRP